MQSETVLGVSRDGVMFCPRDPQIPKDRRCWMCNEKRAKYAAVRFTGQEIHLCIRCALSKASQPGQLRSLKYQGLREDLKPMVTYRVAPGYECTPEKFQQVMEELERLRTDDPFDNYVPLPKGQPAAPIMDYFQEILEGWQSGADSLAVVVYPEEPCIRLNCSGGGVERMAKELHRKAVIARLWEFAMEHQTNLEITSG